MATEILVYILDRSDGAAQVETVQGESDDLTIASFEVDDSEPAEVWGPIFSRIFDHLGLTLSDPGDFSWADLSIAPDGIQNAYLVTIHCDVTEEA